MVSPEPESAGVGSGVNVRAQFTLNPTPNHNPIRLTTQPVSHTVRSTGASQPGEQLIELRRAYQRSMHRSITAHHHESFLSHLLSTGTTPNGLKIQLQPQAFLMSWTNLEETWNAIIRETETKLHECLTNHYRTVEERVSFEMTSILDSMTELTSPAPHSDLAKEHYEKLEATNRNLEYTKQKLAHTSSRKNESLTTRATRPTDNRHLPHRNPRDRKPPRRDDRPRHQRNDGPPRQEDHRPLRRGDYRPPQRNNYQPPRRNDCQPPRHNNYQPPRRDDHQPPRRDDHQPPRREVPNNRIYSGGRGMHEWRNPHVQQPITTSNRFLYSGHRTDRSYQDRRTTWERPPPPPRDTGRQDRRQEDWTLVDRRRGRGERRDGRDGSGGNWLGRNTYARSGRHNPY